MTARKSRPWRMFAPLAGVLLLFAAWSGYWLFAFELAKSQAASRREAIARQGTSLSCMDESWGGYPFRFEFACRAPVLTSKVQEHDVTVRGSALSIVAQAYNPSSIVALLDGPTSIKASNGSFLEAGHERAIASFRYTGTECGRFSIEIPALTVSGVADAAFMALHLRCRNSGANIAMNARDVTVYGTVQGPVRLDAASFDVVVPGLLFAQSKPLLNASVTGTRAEILSAEIAHHGVVVKGKGWLGLDQDRRLAGTIATETNDIDGLLGEANRYHPLSEPDRAALKTLLGLIDNSAVDKQAKADFIAKDGELYWGPVKLADLPPLY
ncbi:MAG: DUF2125 domain-containing protein [Hyphomicrobiales bacterium]